MLCDAVVTCGLYYCVQHFGFNSNTYVYFYYYTDSLLNVLMFWVIIKFYQEAFAEMGVSRYIRGAAVMLILLTAVFSYAVVHQNRTHLTDRFVVEIGQNFYFVGVVLTYLLWGAILKLRETRTRLIQLVLALGVYFSARCLHLRPTQSFPGTGTKLSALGSAGRRTVAANGLGVHLRTHPGGRPLGAGAPDGEGAMIAALICAFSLAIFLQFFVSYCRSILASSRKVALSDRVREVTSIADHEVAADDFNRLLQLVRLCPERGDDQSEIRAVGTYYGLLEVLSRVSTRMAPGLAGWFEQERQNCSYFAAVALDRRISYSRDLYTQQLTDRL